MSRRVHSTRPPSRAASSRSQWASSLFFPRSESSPAGGVLTANVGSASLQEWHSFLADLPWSFKLARGQRRAVTRLLPRRFGSARRFVCCRWPSSCRWGQSELGSPSIRRAQIQQFDSVPAGLAQRTDRFWDRRYPHMDYLNRDGGGGRTQVARPQRIIFSLTAFGTKRTSLVAPHMSAFGGKADMTFCIANVRL